MGDFFGSQQLDVVNRQKGGEMRWHLVLGGVLFLLTSVLILACQGGEEAQPTSTATATPTAIATPTAAATATPTAAATPSPAAESGDWEAFRAFAAQIEAAVADADVDFFVDRAAFREFVCPGPGGEIPQCQEAGQVLRAINAAQLPASGGYLLEPDDVRRSIAGFFQRADPALSDDYGDGQVRLHSISHRLGREGRDEYPAVLTMIPGADPNASVFPGDLRYLLILTFRFQDGRWQFDLVYTGSLVPVFGLEQRLAARADDLDWERR